MHVPCECTISFNYTLTGATLMTSVTLNNNRADHAQFVFSSLIVAGCPLRLRHRSRYGINNQEIPAVYVNGFLDNLVAYTGKHALPKSMISLHKKLAFLFIASVLL